MSLPTMNNLGRFFQWSLLALFAAAFNTSGLDSDREQPIQITADVAVRDEDLA